MFHGRGSVGVALRDQVGQDVHALASQDDLALIGRGQAHALTRRQAEILQHSRRKHCDGAVPVLSKNDFHQESLFDGVEQRPNFWYSLQRCQGLLNKQRPASHRCSFISFGDDRASSGLARGERGTIVLYLYSN